jgi:hypothetical protein
MRKRASLAAIVVAGACAAGASAAGPGDVYNDYVQDGALSCNHSRADLAAVLRSGTLNQYGDPYTLARLKLAVRKQLAGGCRSRSSGPTGEAGRTPGGGKAKPQSKRSSERRRHDLAPRGAVAQASTSGAGGGFLGLGLILGLVAVALAFGGWLTKHALSARD